MAKKGGQQQLQADLTTDDDLERFLDRPGLCVLDVYSEWCGPCLGMVGTLRKIKLEIGGDNLHLAICKADTISYLSRFHKKSEPTWLFVVNGRAVNMMFGTNVPKLTRIITNELQLLGDRGSRRTYDITDLQPEEEKRKKVKDEALAEAQRIENAERERKRNDYLTYVTDTILDNMPDIGVTVFGPQVTRDMFKHIVQPADALKLQCKDRRTIPVTREDFEVVYFACSNRIDSDVLDELEGKELLCCFWKIPDDTNKTVSELLQIYANSLITERVEPADDFNPEERVLPPILSPVTVAREVEVEEGEEWSEESIPVEQEEEEQPEDEDALLMLNPFEPMDVDIGPAPLTETESAIQPAKVEKRQGSTDLDNSSDDKVEVAPPEVVVQKRYRTKHITVPPVWVPNTNRAHAALIYVFFRTQTAPFLPPDPVPEPPHVVMAFDVYKKRDLLDLANRFQQDIAAYGFFTSDDANAAKLIANSQAAYAKHVHQSSDKIVFKVNKQTSHTMLAFATYGPSYVSPNAVVGREDALKFFPASYRSGDVEDTEKDEKDVKKKKKKRSAAADDGTTVETPRPSEFRESAEESSESRPSSPDDKPPDGEGETPARAEGEVPPDGEGAAPSGEGATGEAGEAPMAGEGAAPEGDPAAQQSPDQAQEQPQEQAHEQEKPAEQPAEQPADEASAPPAEEAPPEE